MPEANTQKALVCAPFVKLYKILLLFALGPLVSEILKHKVFFLQFFSWRNKRDGFQRNQLVLKQKRSHIKRKYVLSLPHTVTNL